MAYTNAEEVELFLNGRSLGRKKKGAEPVMIPVGKSASDEPTMRTRYRIQWMVPYRPGTLEAVAYLGGRVVARKSVKTAGVPAKVVIVPDRSHRSERTARTCRSSRCGSKIATAISAHWRRTSYASMSRGKGRLPRSTTATRPLLESFQAPERKAFGGLALLVVRSKRGQPGKIRVGASSEGLSGSVVTLSAR